MLRLFGILNLGAFQTLRDGLDTLASTLITEVNAVYQPGYDQYDHTGAVCFTGTDAATIGINAVLQDDPLALQASGAVGQPANTSVALALAQMAQQSIAALGHQTFSGAYASTVADFGNALANANNQVANFNALNTLLLNQRDSVSGVSMEEEMTSLITFQNAYQAALQTSSNILQLQQSLLSALL